MPGGGCSILYFHLSRHIMHIRQLLALAGIGAAMLLGRIPAIADPEPVPEARGDIPADFKVVTSADDYIKRDVMIPMRDGVKLHTVIVIPKGAVHAPLILDRTPYSADKFARNSESIHRALILPLSFGELAEAGYIIVAQDVRGKYKSEGDYVMNRPLSGEFNQTPVDHSTDAFDTIDWLVQKDPQYNANGGNS